MLLDSWNVGLHLSPFSTGSWAAWLRQIIPLFISLYRKFLAVLHFKIGLKMSELRNRNARASVNVFWLTPYMCEIMHYVNTVSFLSYYCSDNNETNSMNCSYSDHSLSYNFYPTLEAYIILCKMFDFNIFSLILPKNLRKIRKFWVFYSPISSLMEATTVAKGTRAGG